LSAQLSPAKIYFENTETHSRGSTVNTVHWVGLHLIVAKSLTPL
jgi:hypothetical protein